MTDEEMTSKINSLKEKFIRCTIAETDWVSQIRKLTSDVIFDTDMEISRATDIQVNETTEEYTWRSVTDSAINDATD